MFKPELHHKARKSKIHEMKQMLHQMISDADGTQPPDHETQGYMADDPNDDPLEEKAESPQMEAAEHEPDPDDFEQQKKDYFKSKPRPGGRTGGTAKIIAALNGGRKSSNGVAPRPFGKKA